MTPTCDYVNTDSECGKPATQENHQPKRLTDKDFQVVTGYRCFEHRIQVKPIKSQPMSPQLNA